MKLKILATTILATMFSASSFAAMVNKSTIVVDGIQVGKMDGDNLPEQFSLMFNFHNTGNEIKVWQLGFYMPRSFDSLALQRINPEQTMQICDAAGGDCVALKYVRADNVNNVDKAQGYFTLLAPVSQFSLKPKTNYYIKIAHNNQWSSGNVSSLPQSLFLTINDENSDGVPKIYTIHTELSQYQILNYDQNLIDRQIQDNIQAKWLASQPKNIPQVGIIPSPVRIISGVDGDFTLPAKTITIHNQLNSDNAIVNLWAPIIKQDWKLTKKVVIDNDTNASNGILIQSISDPKAIQNNPEGYRLTIANDNITIEALTATGVYYAFQTLRQISAQSANNTLPSLVITDYPRFKYRGVLLDVARHYFTVNEIKTLIDVMANQKLNTLHIHFSDDEAFRLALPSYPELTATASNRGLGQSIGPAMLLQNNLDATNLRQPEYPVANSVYGGSYSAIDIQSIISYANANQITIIPEIDIPGHARALIKALPHAMIDTNDSSQYLSVQGYRDDVLPVCTYGNDISVGNSFTTTINTIVNDIAKIFNQQTTLYAVSNEVSLGADEVSNNAWTNDTSCRNEWSKLSALDKSQLFIQKLAQNNNSLMLSGWQQMVQSDGVALGKYALPTSQVGHVWVWNPTREGVKQAANLANSNYPTILAYADKSYFDLAYSPSITEPGFTWAGQFMDTANVLSLAKAADTTISQSANSQNILGLEGALWSENLPSFDHMMYMALPKMPALAEASWSPSYNVTRNGKTNWQSLANRLGCGKNGYLSYLNKLYGVNYRGYPDGIAKEVPEDFCSVNPEGILNNQ
ncbi:MAG: hypothetical protein EKK57_06365 [Proteobacteria bacterium]|nr:MAG: hypothetical protein EKK57_06365 [Pseudomonadota bacterium]